jgi:hypothetical protein
MMLRTFIRNTCAFPFIALAAIFALFAPRAYAVCLPDNMPPAAPSDLYGSAGSETSIDLSWTDNSYNENAFDLYRDGSYFTSVDPDVTSYTDAGLSPCTTYTYYVRSANCYGVGKSNTISVSTVCGGPPAAPSEVSVSTTDASSLRITWTDNSSDADGFEIYRDGYYVGSVNSYTTAYNDTGLQFCTSYSYYIAAYNSYGSSESGSASGQTSCQPPPAAPSNLAATPSSCGTNTINLSWTDAATNETGYRVYRSGALLAMLAADSTSYSDTSAGLNTARTYYVQAYNAGGTANSNTASVTSPAACIGGPAVPTGIAATAWPCNTQTIAVTWTDAATNETGYRVYRDGSLLADSLPANSTSYYDVAAGTAASHTYYVQAYNASGPASSSLVTRTSPSSCTSGPAAPTNLAATPGACGTGRISLSWTDNATNEYGYKVYRNGSLLATLGSNSTSYNDTAAGTGVQRAYYVQAYPYSGTGSNSRGVAQAGPLACAPPAAPSGLSGSAASLTSISLTWTDNSNDESGFYIYRNGSFFTSVAANTSSYANAGLSECTSYDYYIQSYNAYGTSSSNAATVSTPCKPAVPTSVSAAVTGQATATVTWADNSNNETGFKVYSNGDVLRATVGANAATASITGLTCGTYYHFYVVATADSPNANSAASAISNAITTLACTPGAPTNLTATPGACNSNAITLSWTDNSANEDGFRVYRDGGLIATQPIGSISYSDTAAGAGIQHSYYVQAYNAGGTADSNTITPISPAHCAPATPTNISATATGQAAVTVTWADNSSIEDGFKVYTADGTPRKAAAANATSASVTGLACGTSYQFYVVATAAAPNVNSANSALSAAVATYSCVVSPASASNIVMRPDPGRPQIYSSWDSSSADGYIIVARDEKTGLKTYVDTNHVSATVLVQCPTNYTVSVYAYNNDSGLAGAADTSCASLAASNAVLAADKKCSPPQHSQVRIHYCTQGFFGD